MGKRKPLEPVLWRDPITGERMSMEEINPNTVIGIIGRSSWHHSNIRTRRDNALDMSERFRSLLFNDHSQLLTAAYVHPEKSTSDTIIPDPADALMNKLFALVSKKITGSQDNPDSRARLKLDEAESNMRINFVTYSASTEFIDKMRERLTGGMLALGYDNEEIIKIYQQVFVLNITPSFEVDKRGTPPFNEVNVVVDRDLVSASHWITQPQDAVQFFAVVTPSERVSAAEGRTTTDPYSFYMGIDGIVMCTALRQFLETAVEAQRLNPDLHLQIPTLVGRVYSPEEAFTIEPTIMPTPQTWVERSEKNPRGGPDGRINPTSGADPRALPNRSD